MDKPLSVSFNSPQSGFMSLSLKAADQSFVTAVACQPYDSLRALIEALTALLEAVPPQRFIVKWNCEPDEMDFQITARGDRVEFRIRHFPDHRRTKGTGRTVFSFQGSKLEFCLSFWRALRSLHRDIETDEFDRNWRRPFPETEMRHLTEAVRSFKRTSKEVMSNE
jgi:hypothetical protein